MRLHDFLDYWARERPGAEFVFAGGCSLTFAEAAAAANRLANRLVGVGCGKGTRVAVLARNAPWYPLLYFAAAKAGVVLLPLNCRLAPPEWLRILHDAQPAALIVGRDFVAAADEIRGELEAVRHFVAEGEDDRPGWSALDRWLSDGSARPPAVEVGAADALWQMYTSGTTGIPKGAVLSHGAVCWNIVQVGLAHPVFPGDRGLVVLPMFHAAVIPAALSVLCRGGSVYVLDAFDPEQVVDVLDGERIGVAALVPAMLQAIVSVVENVADRRYDVLRSIYYGASPIAESTLRGVIDAFGCGFVQSYGMTEAAQALTFLTADDHRLALASRPELLLSAGRSAAGTELQVIDGADSPLPAGTPGEILARGPQLMSGYWRRPEATAHALRADWLHTGDVGRIDEDGYLFIEDRLARANFVALSCTEAFRCILPKALNAVHTAAGRCAHFHPSAIATQCPLDRHEQFVRDFDRRAAEGFRNQVLIRMMAGAHISTSKYRHVIASIKLLTAAAPPGSAYVAALGIAT